MSVSMITDKKGKHYRLRFLRESRRRLHIRVFNHEQWIGDVKCYFHPHHKMELYDIQLLDHVIPRGKGWRRFVPHRLREKWWAKTYQNLGIGTALLCVVLDYAKQRDVNFVFGYVIPEDVGHNSHLLEWYRGLGFSIVPEENPRSWTAAWIYLEM